jgi:hypothetical protein
MSALSAPYFHDEDAAYEMLESYLWPHGPVCPRWAVSQVEKLDWPEAE